MHADSTPPPWSRDGCRFNMDEGRLRVGAAFGTVGGGCA